MFVINNDKSIYLTRGDIAAVQISANTSDGELHTFKPGDVVRLLVFEKKRCECVVLKKDVVIKEESPVAEITLMQDDTKIGELIQKPIDYWYEVELNPDTLPQTIIGYDVDGPKIFRLFPEGADK